MQRSGKLALLATTLALTVFSTYLPTAQADEIVVKATGVYKDIANANELSRLALAGLKSPYKENRWKAIATVEKEPDKYTPPVFYYMSKVLFDDGDKDKAAFWFYAGQLRGRYDANRCADQSARAAISVLNQNFGKPINQYMFAHIDQLQTLIPKVMKWDDATGHNYDCRWINLHGMGAMIGEDEEGRLTLPESQWGTILSDTRSDYLKGFNEAIAEFKKIEQPKKL